MNLKNIFKYQPLNEHTFTLETTQDVETKPFCEEVQDKKLYKSLSKNSEYMKIQYNQLINSDITFRNFSIMVKNKKLDALLIYVDGMIDTNLINNYVLKPLMMRNENNTFDESSNKKIPLYAQKMDKKDFKETFHPIFDNNLQSYIYSCLMPQNSVIIEETFDKLISGINAGNCALFVDNIPYGFNIDVKGFKQRSVDKPEIESVIKGPQEAFVENLRTNTSLLRRIVNNQNLIVESIEIGALSKTKCALCYIQNIANSDLVAEAKYRLNNLSIDSLISTGELEQLIQDDNGIGIPQILSTERPDKCVKAMFQGRCIILVNGNPYALIIPSVFTDFLASPEDSNQNPLFTNFLKFIRLIAMLITLLLPGMYIAVTNFHQELFPTELLFSILVARENVPFPIIFELLLMEVSFELIREGGLRTPSAIGSTLGIVGALILGDAAVSANIVSPILIIVVAITGLASFVIPNFSFGFHLRVYRFVFTLLGYIAGFLGIGVGIYVYIATMCSLKSFGVPYVTPISPNISGFNIKYFVPPFWKQEYRNSFLSPKKQQSQDKYSMKWRLK